MTILKSREKVEGVIKEKVGKATGNKKMELKGKTQGTMADVKSGFKSKLNKLRKK